ncbi:MAG: Nitrate/nitrite transporter [Candidatus Carbobacillus altaicus]|uniref:Nitrate/nitrite transporter n=1 Tax=Candidatus Carbonibacillus altaicus TaxID=2163959 RepID=A0A2R6Y058_9BACL|nr:MAG: Nitrate/nitrite transporter [Candidatus Carbobacillus altaicus]
MSTFDVARRKTFSHILPWLFAAYVVAFLDRTNIGYAALSMNQELGLTSEMFGFGAGLFSVGYWLLEIPGAILSERWSAKLWLVRIMITWGIVVVLFAFIQSDWQFYLLRFLLGLAEGGFVPGVLVMLGHWFVDKDRAQAVSLFYIGLPISQVIGGPLAALLLGVKWLGLSGWKWLFLVEGSLAIILGVAILIWMSNRPEEAAWLTEDEKKALIDTIEREKMMKDQSWPEDTQRAGSSHWWYGLKSSITWRIAVSMFLLGIGFYGFNYFVQTITKEISGLTNTSIGLLMVVPFGLAALALYLNGKHSDRTGERRYHTALSWLIGAVGLLLLAYGPHDHVLWLLLWLSISAIGLNAYFGSFWALPQTYLTGLGAAGAIGLINLVGNIGGFVGPYATGVIRDRFGSFDLALVFWVIMLVLGAALIVSLPKETKTPIIHQRQTIEQSKT